MSWIYAPAPITAGALLGITAWAAWATLLAAGQWWLCRHRHCGPHPCAMDRLIAWDEDPPATHAAVAAPGRGAAREAS